MFIDKLRKNYNLVNVLLKIAMALTFAFCNLQLFSAATVMAMGTEDALVTILAAVISGVIMAFLVPVVCNVFLNIARIHSVPRAEYALIATFFWSLSNLLYGLLSLLNLAIPAFSAWGAVLYPFVASTICAVGFYFVTANLYFNSGTKAYYLKAYSFAAAILIIVLGGIVL